LQFDSLAFVAFFVFVASAYWQVRSWSHKKNILLAASYLFYAGWNPYFLPLLIVTSFIDWRLALRMSQSSSTQTRKRWLLVICVVNFSVLAYFKYANFFIENINAVTSVLGMSPWSFRSSIALPIGISFYTFHSLSYCVDVYRGNIRATRSLRDYLLYVAFFPQLVAGPIVRWSMIGEQLKTPRMIDRDTVGMGVALMIVGLFQKIVLADAIFAPTADLYFETGGTLTGMTAWVAALSFSGQIFCDFAGYTTCAIGAALVLGFRLPVNFQAPYAARGFSDFWRRWHISLSSWLRDYLYIPLGGNRGGQLITTRNLLLTMLLGGLWHGAAWTFIIWGALHGFFLVVERATRSFFEPFSAKFPRLGRAVGWWTTLLAVVTAWVFFRADSLAHATIMIKLMYVDFPLSAGELFATSYEDRMALLAVFALFMQQLILRDIPLQRVLHKLPWPVLGIFIGAMTVLISLTTGQSNAFIYFQF